jgi:hypothetical protein
MASAVRLAVVRGGRQDQVMKRTGRSVWVLVGLWMLFPACSRQRGLLPPKQNAQSNPLPFDNPSHSAGIYPTQAFASTSIPAGTAIMIRLQSSLSSADSHSGDQFQAVLEEPIVVQGQALAASGTAITGRVLEARACEPPAPGYLRLTLSAVVMNGKAMDLHTSSVFSKGDPREQPRSAASAELAAGTKDVQFSTGRRLTFRLIQPLPLPESAPSRSAFY